MHLKVYESVVLWDINLLRKNDTLQLMKLSEFKGNSALEELNR